MLFLFLSSYVFGQKTIECFPNLPNFIIPEFANSNNIFPIAIVEAKIGNEFYKIPISYSFLSHNINNKHFYLKKIILTITALKFLKKEFASHYLKRKLLYYQQMKATI